MTGYGQDYTRAQTELTTIANLILHTNLELLIARGQAAEAVGPILDPTLYRQAAEALGRILRIAGAAQDFKKVVEREFREAGWRRMPAIWTANAVDIIWVAGRVVNSESSPIAWAIQGVFETKEKAIAACRDEWYFIGPLRLNESLPDTNKEWPGCFYPLAEKDSQPCPD